MEERLHYIWKHRLYPARGLMTVDNEPVCVLDPGVHNQHAGPDFFNAKVLIGGQEWAGNVEIHVKASDWHRHGHDGDRSYDNVILHVVATDDTRIVRSDGSTVPQMVLKWNDELEHEHNQLIAHSSESMPCLERLSDKGLPQLLMTEWLTALGYERVRQKAERVESIRMRFDGDWQMAGYVTLARALGFGLNSEPFERLACSIPLKVLTRHADRIELLEALLFGQSGLLEQAPDDDSYVAWMREEYQLYAMKYGLRPLSDAGWRTARTRPANQPHRRIAALATMLHLDYGRVMKRLLDAALCPAAEARDKFRLPLSAYWQTRYGFGPTSGATPPWHLSDASIDRLLINAVAPVMYAYSLHRGDKRMIQRATDMLEQLPPERCADTRLIGRYGYNTPDALMSQGVIQLRRQYCDQRKCIYCRIGHRLLCRSITKS